MLRTNMESMNNKAVEGILKNTQAKEENFYERIQAFLEGENKSGVSTCSKTLRSQLVPLPRNGVEAKVKQQQNKVGMNHKKIIELLDEAKLPMNLSFKKAKKKVRILTPRSSNLLLAESGKNDPAKSLANEFFGEMPPNVNHSLTLQKNGHKNSENGPSVNENNLQNPKVKGKSRQQKRREYMQRQRARAKNHNGDSNQRNQQGNQSFQQQDPRFQQQDPRFQQQHPRFQQRDQRSQQRNPRFQQRDPRFQQQEPRFQQQEPRFQQGNQNFQQRDPRFQQQDPRFQQQDPRFQQRDQRFQQRNPRFQQRDPRFQQRDPRFNRNPRSEYHGEFEEARYHTSRDTRSQEPRYQGGIRRPFFCPPPQSRFHESQARSLQRPAVRSMKRSEPKPVYMFSDESVVSRLMNSVPKDRYDKHYNQQSHLQGCKEHSWKSAKDLYKPGRESEHVGQIESFAPRKDNGSWSQILSSPLMLDSLDNSSADGRDSCSESGKSSARQSIAGSDTLTLSAKELNETLVKLSMKHGENVDHCATQASRLLAF